MKRILPWLVAIVVKMVGLTCRFHIINDPRDDLSARGISHVFAAMHAHQIAAAMVAQPGSAIMVSRSDDGEIVVPTLKMLGHVPVRGSVGTRKGGAVALQALVKHVRSGLPGILAVDGPRGPRGHVQPGIGMLAKKSDAVVLVAAVIPRRRLILKKTWDRLQIPLPFTRVDVYVSQPLRVASGEEMRAFALRVEAALKDLEAKHDPSESVHFAPRDQVEASGRGQPRQAA